MPDIQLETARLILRPPRAQDFDPWAELATDAETMRHLGGVQPRPVAWRSFLFVVGSWQIQGFSAFSAIEKETGRWVGRVGPLMPEGWPGTEIGWTFARHAWGKGYATEGAAAATEWAWNHLGWTEIIHCIDAGNTASQKVAKRLGSRILRQAQMPPPYENTQVDIWGQTRAEWFARRGIGA
jgi:RimJ/RimL family protein N-acetyltransferase